MAFISGSGQHRVGERIAQVMVRALLKVLSRHSPGLIEKPVKMVGREARTRMPTHCRSEVRDVTAWTTENWYNF